MGMSCMKGCSLHVNASTKILTPSITGDNRLLEVDPDAMVDAVSTSLH